MFNITKYKNIMMENTLKFLFVIIFIEILQITHK